MAEKEELDKQDNGLLVPFEKWIGRTGLPWVPACVTPNQITLFGGVSGMTAGVCLYLASDNSLWFVAVAVLVFTQWAADNIDGHVARSRGQASPAGRFLDIFMDVLSFSALGMGAAFASYTDFQIVAVATVLMLLQYVLTLLWIALAGIWPFPPFGPAESSLTLIILSLVMVFVPGEIFSLGQVSFSLLDLAFALTIPGSVITLIVSSLRLYRHLESGS